MVPGHGTQVTLEGNKVHSSLLTEQLSASHAAFVGAELVE